MALSADTARLGDAPMPPLTILKLKEMKGADGKNLKVIPKIATGDYMTFGMYLLQDENGDQVELIKRDHRQDGIESVVLAIIRKWLASDAAPTQYFIECLRKSELGALAKDIANALAGEGTTLAGMPQQEFNRGMQSSRPTPTVPDAARCGGPSLNMKVPNKPNMTPEKLKKFILSERSLVSAGVALLTFVGLPDCKKADLVQEILQKGLELDPEELMKSAEITEKDTEFRVLELGAFRDGTQTWTWYPFAKRSRYLSCFLSALQRDTRMATINSFAVKERDHGKHRFDLFKSTELDKCFYNHYQLLSTLYNEPAAERAQVEPAAERTLVDQLKGETTLTLINVWDIGFNKAILHFLPLLCGHLHHNFPILFLGYPNDVGVDSTHLAEPLNIDESVDKKLSGMKPILRHCSRAKFLLSFSHLARSCESYQIQNIMRKSGEDPKRKEVCRLVGIVHGKESQHPEDSGSSQNDPALYQSSLRGKIGNQLDRFSMDRAKENLYCIENLLGSPWVIDQKVAEDKEEYTKLKMNIDEHVASEKQKDIPLSWYFLRSAFFKTGKLYIKTTDLEGIANECKITRDKFKQFLETFTGFGSIIHIPDIPVLCEYVILNPPDFFHKLTELYYPRFNGDLKYGIASFSTMRRLFGEDFEFFVHVLTACKLAVKIDSDRIVHDDRTKTEQRRLLFSEECLYIPSIRSVARPDESSNSTGLSLRLVYKKAHLPTHTTEDVVTFLVAQNDRNLHLLTCEWYNVTRFQYYYNQVVVESDNKSAAKAPPVKRPLVKLTMISHGDKNEMLIEAENIPSNRKDVKQLIADIKETVIRAYCNAEKVYSQHHYKLLGVEPELELELNCTRDRSKYHNITANIQTSNIQTCASCKQNKELMAMWEFASKHWKAR